MAATQDRSRLLLIDAVVRHTTVLLAALATAGGRRAPLTHVADEIFLNLSREIEAQGVSRKVSADMFGLALRSYQRKVHRSTRCASDGNLSLWQAIQKFVQDKGPVTREQLFQRFDQDDESAVRGVLHDLKESGLIELSGIPGKESIRFIPREELKDIERGLDDLIAALIFREGPLTEEQLLERTRLSKRRLRTLIGQLEEESRIVKTDEGYDSVKFTQGFEDEAGWEAAVYDHFAAMVRTFCVKLNQKPVARLADITGGSTYSMQVWPGHPFYEEVTGSLARIRTELFELRRKVSDYNKKNGVVDDPTNVVTYVGQSAVAEGD